MIDYASVTDTFKDKLGCPVDLVDKNIEQLTELYEELFIGAYMITQPQALSGSNKPGYESALDWLRTTDFYLAPASTQYHESIPGGLLLHCLKVYNRMIDLLKCDAFKSVNIAEATLVVLVHDWCKIDYYETYTKNVKDEKTGKWSTVAGYKVNQRGLPMGHGVTSMYLASRCMRLTPEQALAIRWHMGRWNVATVEENEFQKSNELYPMIHLVQFADQLAITDF